MKHDVRQDFWWIFHLFLKFIFIYNSSECLRSGDYARDKLETMLAAVDENWSNSEDCNIADAGAIDFHKNPSLF